MPRPNRFYEPTVGRMWHPDGRPFTAQDYRDAGATPPTKEQLAFWAEQDAERAAERNPHRNRTRQD